MYIPVSLFSTQILLAIRRQIDVLIVRYQADIAFAVGELNKRNADPRTLQGS